MWFMVNYFFDVLRKFEKNEEKLYEIINFLNNWV